MSHARLIRRLLLLPVLSAMLFAVAWQPVPRADRPGLATAYVLGAEPSGSAAPSASQPDLSPSPDPAPTPQPSSSPSASASQDPSATPTPDPGASPSPTSSDAAPSLSPSPAPSDSPAPSPAPQPSDSLAPSGQPSDSPAPGDSASPSESVVPSESPSESPSEVPSPSPTLAWSLTSGQQQGSTVRPPQPLYKLSAGPLAQGSSPHTGYTLTSPDCSQCHATHTAQGTALNQDSTQAAICYTCHDGSGSNYDIKTAFASVPANDPAQDAYFSHPVGDASSSLHTLASDNEFEGTLDRHAVCADCHNAHQATATRPVQSTTGWTAPGSISGAPAVGVKNGAAGTAPVYALKPGNSVTYEYELCLKCHSGWTTLPTRSAAHPSFWALDAGIEFNPANSSYHPIEAAGKNQTSQLAASLAGTSPFKAWNFQLDSTIRCANCHGDPSTVNQTPSASPLAPAAGAIEASHASPNRGLLTAPYRDRSLKAADESYTSTDFALCYLCHAERPFVDVNPNPSAPDTLFSLHGEHMVQFKGDPNTNLSIDHAGDGSGLALCAECHFRPHSTAIAYKIGDQVPTARATGSEGLVNFAPDVQGVGGTPPTWVQPSSTGQGSCTLTCHGHTHSAADDTYVTGPGAGFTASPVTGAVGASGLTVQFTDASKYIDRATDSWSWDFGDGSTSTLVSPSHVYAQAGSFTVTLTVTRTSGDGLSSTLVRSSYVTVTP